MYFIHSKRLSPVYLRYLLCTVRLQLQFACSAARSLVDHSCWRTISETLRRSSKFTFIVEPVCSLVVASRPGRRLCLIVENLDLSATTQPSFLSCNTDSIQVLVVRNNRHIGSKYGQLNLREPLPMLRSARGVFPTRHTAPV